MRKSQILSPRFILLLSVAVIATWAYASQQQTAPRKYLIVPMNLGTNTEIRARSTRSLQVQVTDENDHPVPDVPLLFLLSGLIPNGNLAGSLAGQNSLRVLTNKYGVVNVNFNASDSIGQAMRLQVQMEGTPIKWDGELNLVQPDAVFELPPDTAPPLEDASLPTLEAEEQNCLAQINQLRAENQQPPVKVSARLTKAAQWLSRDNADNKPDDPKHTDSLGRDFSKRLVAFGYTATILAENIVVGAKSATEAMDVWIHSSYHVRNLLHSEIKVVGISRVCKTKAKSSCHWTVVLGSREDQLIP